MTLPTGFDKYIYAGSEAIVVIVLDLLLFLLLVLLASRQVTLLLLIQLLLLVVHVLLDQVVHGVQVDVQHFLLVLLDVPPEFVADEDGDVDEYSTDGQEEGFVLHIGVFDDRVEVDEELEGTTEL